MTAEAAASSAAAEAAARPNRPLRIVTWNVNSLPPTARNIDLKHGSLAAFFDALGADIVCLQEVKLPDAKLSKPLALVDGWEAYFACSGPQRPGYSGVTTYARRGAAAAAAVELDPLAVPGCAREGRCVASDHGAFVLYNVYVPNAGEAPARPSLARKVAFLEALLARVDADAAAGREIIVVGDINIAAADDDVHPTMRPHEAMYDAREHDAMRALLGRLDDAWRRLHPTEAHTYTVWCERTSARTFNLGHRIDYALVSPGLRAAVASCEVLLDGVPHKWSDHAPVKLELALPAPAAARLAEADAAPPCPEWRALRRRFDAGAAMAAMFGGQQRKPKQQQQQQLDQKGQQDQQQQQGGGSPVAGDVAGDGGGGSGKRQLYATDGTNGAGASTSGGDARGGEKEGHPPAKAPRHSSDSETQAAAAAAAAQKQRSSGGGSNGAKQKGSAGSGGAGGGGGKKKGAASIPAAGPKQKRLSAFFGGGGGGSKRSTSGGGGGGDGGSKRSSSGGGGDA